MATNKDDVEEKEDVMDVKLGFSTDDADEHGFVSIWNLARESCDGSQENTRTLAGKMLGFLCKQKAEFVVISTADAEYLDGQFEQSNKLLYDWKPGSEFIDIIAQHAEVYGKSAIKLMERKKFSVEKNYAPRRVDRVEWFQDTWKIG
ncbi:MAG: hypothetical protein AAFP90_03750 [Planctomycetota bacterium]